jgi:hypothetical protein
MAQFAPSPMWETVFGASYMTIQTNSLTELLKVFPADATVRGFDDGLAVRNADGSGEVVMLNDSFYVPSTAVENTNHPTSSDCENLQNAAETTRPTRGHGIRIVARKSV